MVQDTPLGFPAHTLPYRCERFTFKQQKSVGNNMFPTLFLVVAILFVKYVDIEMIVGHFNIVLGEGVP